MEFYTTKSGLTFELDTCDWDDKADGETAQQLLKENLENADQDKLKEAVEIYKADVDADIPELLFDIGNDAFIEATKEYMGCPETGHNCSAYPTIDDNE
jgi:hypothetical protein